jgi:hypothetical protein
LHQDKFRSRPTPISKEEWERIFGKREDALKEEDKAIKKTPVRRRDSFTGRGERWV